MQLVINNNSSKFHTEQAVAHNLFKGTLTNAGTLLILTPQAAQEVMTEDLF